MSFFKYSYLICLSIAFINCNSDENIYVSKSGSNSNTGTSDYPFLTISKAAEIAKPGQTILISEGIYREYINPSRGGVSDNSRITFQSAKGETVFIKGSEEINSWVNIGNGLWEVQLDTSFFNGYNPYTLNVDGDFQNYGQWHSRGDVYLNNSAFYERQTLDEVKESTYTWYTETDNGLTSIFGNFGYANPNEELVEINVRELIFYATNPEVDYITIDGLRFLHAAPNWQAPNEGDGDQNRLLQVGAVGSNMGKGWIIENSEIAHSKTAGIMFGENEGLEASFEDITQFGDHIIRNNVIHKNGQYGISGQKGISRSEISGNRIENINYRNEFGGYEPAGIKIWNSSDVLIENNFIHRVIANQNSESQAYCVWIDFANQGTRITRNFLIGGENTTTALFLEANVGPTLVDNNIIIDKPEGAIMVYSGGSIFAHNLFVDSNFDFRIQEFGNQGSGARRAYTLKPHSTIRTNMGIPIEIEHNKMYNNIFAGANGPIEFGPSTGIGNVVDNNLYIGGAKSNPEHLNATISEFDFTFEMQFTIDLATLSFQMDDSFAGLNTSLIDANRVGKIPYAEQGLADRSGRPITVNWDFNKQSRKIKNPVVGPIKTLSLGYNSIQFRSPVLPTPTSIYFNPEITRE